jgi:hypothetical protein
VRGTVSQRWLLPFTAGKVLPFFSAHLAFD